MWKKEHGKYVFMLIDFDMATRLIRGEQYEGSFGCASADCTGTLPFMARELIQDYLDGKPYRHRLRHDLESLLYVCVWALCMFVREGLTTEEGEILEAMMRAWENPDEDIMRLVVGKKDSLCLTGLKLRLSPDALPLEGWFRAWTKLFTAGLLAEQAHDEAVLDHFRRKLPIPAFDRETMNGTFTPKALRDALTPYMPIDDAGNPREAFVDAILYDDILPQFVETGDDDEDVGENDPSQKTPKHSEDVLEVDEALTPPRSETAVALTDADEDHASDKTGPSTTVRHISLEAPITLPAVSSTAPAAAPPPANAAAASAAPVAGPSLLRSSLIDHVLVLYSEIQGLMLTRTRPATNVVLREHRRCHTVSGNFCGERYHSPAI